MSEDLEKLWVIIHKLSNFLVPLWAVKFLEYMKDGRLLKKDSPSWSYVFRKRASDFDLCVKSGCSPKARLPHFGSQVRKKKSCTIISA